MWLTLLSCNVAASCTSVQLSQRLPASAKLRPQYNSIHITDLFSYCGYIESKLRVAFGWEWTWHIIITFCYYNWRLSLGDPDLQFALWTAVVVHNIPCRIALSLWCTACAAMTKPYRHRNPCSTSWRDVLFRRETAVAFSISLRVIGPWKVACHTERNVCLDASLNSFVRNIAASASRTSTFGLTQTNDLTHSSSLLQGYSIWLMQANKNKQRFTTIVVTTRWAAA